MKINWFSPLPPAPTDIANYTFALLPVLSQEAELVLWTNQTEWSEAVEDYGTVKQYQGQALPWSTINEADLTIYHIGNNAQFHQEIWQISQLCPGLVVLHDTKLLHFFTGLYLNHYQDKQKYLQAVEQFYGVKGAQIAGAIWDGHLDINLMVDDYPLTPLALTHSLGAIVHNQEAYEEIKGDYWQLLAYLPLSYRSSCQLPSISPKPCTLPYQLVIFGYLGSNRRLKPFLQALSTFKQQNCFELTICGYLEREDEVLALIQEYDLDDQVTVKGFVPEEELEKTLSQADLAINLRYPTMGEASGSQLRIWSHSLPSLVTNTGWYGQLPENTVAFVDPKREIAAIKQQLWNFLDNPQSFQKIGQEGRKILEEKHTTEVYVQGLLAVAQKACELRHRSMIDSFSSMIGDSISQWQTPNTYSLNMDNISETLSFFVGSNDS